ncbi:MAG: helix-turn-helix domain-containing protein [Gammaproteobacteria bacterium]|nr:helix-turn-helix domain-containing protein [Gammaproteobacteria bacterium]
MSYVQLTSEERYVIYHLKLCKMSLREIARRLGRHHTSISGIKGVRDIDFVNGTHKSSKAEFVLAVNYPIRLFREDGNPGNEFMKQPATHSWQASAMAHSIPA